MPSLRFVVVAVWLCSIALPLAAGDPVPDVDVILEQVPGGLIAVLEAGTSADEVLIAVPAEWLAEPTFSEVPAGWTAQLVRGKQTAVLQLVRCGTAAAAAATAELPTPQVEQLIGPKARDRLAAAGCGDAAQVAQPALRMKAGTGKEIGKPAKGAAHRVTVESYAQGVRRGRTVDAAVDVLAAAETAGSLAGIVRLPPTLSPGETVTATLADADRLPPGGMWSIGGVVLDEAAPEVPPQLVSFSRMQHEVAKGIIRNMKRFDAEVYAPIAIAGDGAGDAVGDDAGIAIKEKGIQRALVNTTRGNIRRRQQIAVYELEGGGLGLRRFAVVETAGTAPCTGGDPALRIVAGVGGETATPLGLRPCPSPPPALPADAEIYAVSAPGGASIDDIAAALVTPSEAGQTCGMRTVQAAPRPGVRRDGKRLAFDLPDDLPTGVPLAIRYLDKWGRSLLDVSAAGGVTALPAAPADGPAIEGGHRVVTAGGEACVCGRFPTPAAQGGLLLDGEALGPPPAASASSAVFVLPSGLAIGRHVISGDPAFGFGAGDRLEFDVVRIEASLDQNELWRGSGTSLRLRVAGSEQPLRLQVVNRTPSIISLEGGDEQAVTTSGGSDNAATRTVRGVTRGAFDIGWELLDGRCPCAGAAP